MFSHFACNMIIYWIKTKRNQKKKIPIWWKPVPSANSVEYETIIIEDEK